MKLKLFLQLFFVAFLIQSCTPKAEYTFLEGEIFGTYYHITYLHPQGKDLQEGIAEVFADLNHSLSTYDPNSVISKVNKNEETELDPYFVTVFNKGEQISKITNGAFDMTVAPMVNVWGFGFKNKEQVSAELIDSLKQLTGYQKIRLKNGAIVKDHPNTMLDASAIAKGFGVDAVAAYVRDQGCTNYMVEIGGEVVAHGTNPKGNAWSIGISKPDDEIFFKDQQLQAIVGLTNQALATSGNYRNFYIEDGKKYAHTIDPKTGYPVQHSLLSTTVLADSCMTADAYATAFMVMGLEKSIEVARQVSEIEVYFIYADEEGNYQSYISDGFKSKLLKEY